MRQHRRDTPSERAMRAYALVLRLYPRAHRQAFGEPMLQAFQDHYHDAVETGAESIPLFWLGVLGDTGKSLVTEHVAAVRARVWTMKKALIGILVAGLLVIGLLLANLPGRSPAQNPGLPVADPIWRPILELAMLLLTLGLYAALVAAIVLFARNVLRQGRQPGWVRLGLVLGGIFSLYAVIANVLGTFLPAPDDGGQFGGHLLATLPLLLTGVVGMIASYSSGTIRTGTFAGLLAGFLGVVADQASSVLMMVFAWLAIQHHLGPAGIANDYQRFIQYTGHAPDLGTYISYEYLEDGIGLPIAFSLIALTFEGLCAALGGWIGASLRRADRLEHQAARLPVPTARPARFLLMALALDLLVWITTVELNALGAAHRVFGLSDLGDSFANRSFGLWLLGFLAVLAFVLVTARPAPTRLAASAS